MADVLIVDDQPDIRYAIARVLESAGHQVTEAAEADEARSLMGGAFDLIICDIQLPGDKGVRLIRDAANSAGGVKVVALIGEGLASSARSFATAKALSVDAVLRTPFEFETLLGTVDRLLDPRAKGRTPTMCEPYPA
jgi:two-component system chemotaxis response regulator CheY